MQYPVLFSVTLKPLQSSISVQCIAHSTMRPEVRDSKMWFWIILPEHLLFTNAVHNPNEMHKLKTYNITSRTFDMSWSILKGNFLWLMWRTFSQWVTNARYKGSYLLFSKQLLYQFSININKFCNNNKTCLLGFSNKLIDYHSLFKATEMVNQFLNQIRNEGVDS